MKWTVSSLALALALSTSAAFAQTQTTRPDASSALSSQNSGAGIAGQPGNKSGPAARSGATVGSGANSSQHNPTVQQQDLSKVKGMRGNKNGPPAKY